MGQFLLRVYFLRVCLYFPFPLLPSRIPGINAHASYFLIYETKGLTLEQVDELYGVISSARKSKQFRPQISFADVDPSSARKSSLTEIAQGQERKRSVQHEEVAASGMVGEKA
jgi:hypothetical protein